MTISKYQGFMLQQSKDFTKLIHKEKVPEFYINEDKEGITLKELEELDDLHIIPYAG